MSLERSRRLIERFKRGMPEKRPSGPKPIQDRVMGDFQSVQTNEKGNIVLPPEQMEPVMTDAKKHEQKYRFSRPSFLKGHPVAAKYDSRVGTFSTRTAIIEDDDGRRIFAITNPATSSIHRVVDGIQKGVTGVRAHKVRSGKWKKAYEEKSNLPVIENPDRAVVLLPFIPNVNAQDLFARNREISDFGVCDWAQEIDLEGKLQIGETIVHDLEDLHQRGITWGEVNLNNIIITKDKKPIIVDSENRYYKRVALPEQKARDLRQFLYSMAGALHKSEGVEDFDPIVKRILDKYRDDEVVATLQNISRKNGSILLKAEEAGLLQIKGKEHDKVSEAIRRYKRKPNQLSTEQTT